MKIWLIALFILSGCSSNKKEKDFQASLDKPGELTPEAQVEAPEKLLEKFEVEKIETVTGTEKKTLEQKISPAKDTNKSVVVKHKAIKPALPLTQDVPVNKLPKDYPAPLVSVNAKAEKVWSKYKPNHIVDQKVFLDIHYLGMTVGKIMVTNRGKKMINGKEVWHFHSRFKSAPFYSNIYELDDTVDTYVTTDQFLSSRYSLIQRETKQNVDDLQLHDREQMKTFWFYKQKKSNGDIKNKEKKEYIPYFSIDPFSVLFLFQGLPMKNGDIYEIPIINKGKILILRSEVEGREEIQTELGDKKSIRIHATTKYTGETLKDGDLYFWFSDNASRTLLKAQAKIKIGSVTADIVDGK